MHRKLIIIGAGPAGYTAGIYAARAGYVPLLITGLEPGGQLTITTDVENYPGFVDPVEGPWLVEQMRDQALRVGCEIVTDLITTADFSEHTFRLIGDSGTEYTADAVIIATGAKARWLGLDSESHFQGHGVSACATCDGMFYRGKDVVVVGGGNTAVEEALFLAHLCRKVTLIHRRDTLRADKVLQQRLFDHPAIEVIWNAEVVEITGDDRPKSVTGVDLRETRTGDRTSLKADGIFVAIGHDPASALFADQLQMKAAGYLWTAPDSTATSIP